MYAVVYWDCLEGRESYSSFAISTRVALVAIVAVVLCSFDAALGLSGSKRKQLHHSDAK